MADKLVDANGYRAHDREMLAEGRKLGYRVIEPAFAECYFCDEVDVMDTDEHIIPKWFQRRMGMKEEEFTPTYFSSPASMPHQRRAVRAWSLVARGICATCNNGWMSRLENNFANTHAQDHLQWDIDTVVRWFVKTCVVLNVGQNNRLLVPRDVRLSLAAGQLDPRLSLTFHRVEQPEANGGRVNWAQAFSMPGVRVPEHLTDAFQNTVRQSWACALRLDDIVGTVIYTPEPHIALSSWERLGYEALTDSQIADTVPWSALPKLSHFGHGVAVVPDPQGPLGAVELLDSEFPEGVLGPHALIAYMAALALAVQLAMEDD